MVVGDIGGVCLPKSNLTQNQADQFAAMERRWTGVTRKHLEKCAKRAANATTGGKAAPPGVIVVAIGRNKAGCIFEAIKAGLVNHLIVDQDVEAELSKLVADALKGDGN
jgi:hypothetical protein